MKKLINYFILAIFILAGFTGCKKNEDDPVSPYDAGKLKTEKFTNGSYTTTYTYTYNEHGKVQKRIEQTNDHTQWVNFTVTGNKLAIDFVDDDGVALTDSCILDSAGFITSQIRLLQGVSPLACEFEYDQDGYFTYLFQDWDQVSNTYSDYYFWRENEQGNAIEQYSSWPHEIFVYDEAYQANGICQVTISAQTGFTEFSGYYGKLNKNLLKYIITNQDTSKYEYTFDEKGRATYQKITHTNYPTYERYFTYYPDH